MLKAGVDLKQVSGRLGHASYATTADIYLHPDEEMDRAAAEATANLIARA
jgi:hypothetical protein